MSDQLPPPLPAPRNNRLGDDLGMRVLLPVGRSVYAIVAGYLGLISILLIPAPMALVMGIIAVWDIRRSKGTENEKFGMGRAIFGIVMGGLVTGAVVYFWIFERESR